MTLKFICKECRNSYSRHKHITFKQNEFIIKDGYCLLNNYFKIDIEDIQKIKELNCYISKMSNGYGRFIKVGDKEFKKHFPTLEKAIQWRERMEQELNFYRGGV